MAMHQEKCLFCDILGGRLPAEVVYRDHVCAVILDAFPLTRGHLLVIPHGHAQHIEELPASSVTHMFALGSRLSAALRSRGEIPATHLLLNNGAAANQHVAHVHLHVIPRRRGDSWYAVWRFLTRFINPFSYLGRERRLARDAVYVREMLALNREVGEGVLSE
ncbi:MAG TPA: HIT family protein [Noviherbaspirillum sp.]